MPSATATAPAPASAPAFDFDGAWRLHPRVAIRYESFGALAYHFGTRRLSFLKSPALRSLVESLEDHPTVRAAWDESGIAEEQLPAYTAALATLAASDMICPKEMA